MKLFLEKMNIMENKEMIAKSIAEEIVLDIKKDFKTDFTYTWYNEEDGTYELKFSPKGEHLVNRFTKIVLNYINE